MNMYTQWAGREDLLKETAFYNAASTNTRSAFSTSSGSTFAITSLFPKGTIIAGHAYKAREEGALKSGAHVPYAFSPVATNKPEDGTSSKAGAALDFDSPTKAKNAARAPIGALGTLSLSARVYLRLCLALPPDLAASLIQAWWRGFAVREVLPVLLIHAHHVCAIVHRHRKRLLVQVESDEDSKRSAFVIHKRVGEEGVTAQEPALMGPMTTGSPHRGAAASPQLRAAHPERSTATDTHILTHSPAREREGQASGRRLQGGGGGGGQTRKEAESGLKRKLALSWSAKRITYPLPNDLASSVPYVSARTHVTVCLCFVTNQISFHLAARIGQTGSDEDANPTAQVPPLLSFSSLSLSVCYICMQQCIHTHTHSLSH